ncbi:MAG: hypothetical protein K2L94_01720, partial [Alphaproteobacteria bacterium]|nr:hypothetical protein [Alphaproteobacteria bacterium]
MKFKLLYSLSLVAIVAGGGLMYGTADGYNAVKNDKKKPAKTGVVYSDLREVIDTVYVTNENLDTVRFTGAAGQFNCVNNTVHISYYVANSSLPRIQMYVDGCNAMIPMVRRHETEHARKALMTKRLNHLSVNSRAAVAAMNEIMAPASEIIELMD